MINIDTPIIIIDWDTSLIPVCLPNGRCIDCNHYVPNGKPQSGSCIKRKMHVRNENGCEYFTDLDLSYL